MVLGLHLVCVTRCPGFFERQGFTKIPMHAVPEKPDAARLPRRKERVAMELALPWTTAPMSWSAPDTDARAA